MLDSDVEVLDHSDDRGRGDLGVSDPVFVGGSLLEVVQKLFEFLGCRVLVTRCDTKLFDI